MHDATAAARAAGVIVTIGTGRTLDYIRHSLHGNLQLMHPVMTTQGAVIGDPITGRVLAEEVLPLDKAREIAAFVDAHRYPTAFYFNDAEGHTQVLWNTRSISPDQDALLQHLLGAPVAIVDAFQPLLAAPDARWWDSCESSRVIASRPSGPPTNAPGGS